MSLSAHSRWEPPQPISRVSKFRTRCQNEKQQPFLDHAFMTDSTDTAYPWRDLRYPRLKRFELEGEIIFNSLLGSGIDGIVWKVEIRSQIFALKVFWDNQPPEGTRYWAIQRECHNASLLEAIRLAIEHSEAPIWLNSEPKSKHDAAKNLYAFSKEGLLQQPFKNATGARQYCNVPNLRRCYGWTTLKSEQLGDLPSDIRPREVQVDGVTRRIAESGEYYAIVYEYVPESEKPIISDLVQDQLDLFWLSGFCLTPLRVENWKGNGILVDMADLICPWHAGWFPTIYERKLARDVIAQ